MNIYYTYTITLNTCLILYILLIQSFLNAFFIRDTLIRTKEIKFGGGGGEDVVEAVSDRERIPFD